MQCGEKKVTVNISLHQFLSLEPTPFGRGVPLPWAFGKLFIEATEAIQRQYDTAVSPSTSDFGETSFNPRCAGASSQLPLAGGGGVYRLPPSNFRTNGRSEKRETAIKSSQRGDSNAILKFS